MFCSNCGSRIPDDVRFCPSCGAPVDAGQRPGSTDGYGYQPSPVVPEPMGHAAPINSSRGLLTLILLSIVTCGIYQWYFVYKLAQDINVMCEGDAERTPGLAAFILLSIITCGLYSYWWYYKIGNRPHANAPRYGLVLQENGTTVLLWLIFGSFLCFVGSFIGVNIVIKNTNAMAAAYNARRAMR